MMDCNEAQSSLKAGPVDAPSTALAAHLRTCEACRAFRDDVRVDALLKATDFVPPPRERFVDDVIASAVSSGAYGRQRFIARAASIAALAFATLALMLLMNRPDGSSPIVTLAAHQGKTVRVVIESPTAEESATLTIELGDHLELVGYPSDRRIQWQTSLSEGKNLLALPLILTDDASSQFNVTLRHGSTQNQIHVRVRPAPDTTDLSTKA